jgi:eukaryotic-like serine/threonine-protein kinase
VARIGAQVAAALAAAHEAGIVHRDVEPANVMVLGDGAPLTDFGIARVKGDPKLTATGLIVGSPAYMAPEQASGAAAGPEADLWRLGATLCYAVEGRPPFERDGQIAVLNAVVNEQPRATRRAGPLGPVIAALLSKDPDRRPDAAGLRGQLEGLAVGHGAPAAAARAGTAEKAPGEATAVDPEGAGGAADGGDRHQHGVPPQPAAGRSNGVAGYRDHQAHKRHVSSLARCVHEPGARLQRAADEPAACRSGCPARMDAPAGRRWGLHARLPARMARLGTLRWPEHHGRQWARWTTVHGPVHQQPERPHAGVDVPGAGFSDRPGYQPIRLEPGRYKGLDAAVWEFTQLEGGQLTHKLDVTFKSADGAGATLSGQFERAFAPIG